MRRVTSLFVLVIFLACATSGCRSSPVATAPADTPTPRDLTPTPVPPTPTLPAPTSTPVPPTTTAPVVSATDTPSPVLAPSATPVPTRPQERWQVRTLLVGPGEPGRLYALIGDLPAGFTDARTPWFLISDDYGETWSDFPGGLPAQECVHNVNLDYATPDALYASTCQGLHRWSGTDWELISPQETGMVAVVYGGPEVFWATETFEAGAGVIRSDDGGVTWTLAGSGLIAFNGVANVAIDPRDANKLYAIIWPKYGGSYLRRGTAGGQWKTMPTPQDNSQIGVGMTIDGANGALYVIVKVPTHQLWRTLNPNVPDVNEVQWELVHDFGRDVQVELLASGWSPDGLALYANLSPLDWQDASYALVGDPVPHRSLDGGRTWTPLLLPVLPT